MARTRGVCTIGALLVASCCWCCLCTVRASTIKAKPTAHSASLCVVQWDTRHLSNAGKPVPRKSNNAYLTAMVTINKRLCEADPACHYVKVRAGAYLDLPPYWAKVKVVRDALDLRALSASIPEPHSPSNAAQPRACKTVFWLDSDAVFHVYHRPLSGYVREHVQGTALAISTDPFSPPGSPIANAGVWSCNNSEEGRAVLQAWYAGYEESAAAWHAPRDSKLGKWRCLKPPNATSPRPEERRQRPCPWAGEDYEQGYFNKVLKDVHGRSITFVNATAFANESCGQAALRAAGLGEGAGKPREKVSAQGAKVLQEKCERSVFDLSFQGVRHFLGYWSKRFCVEPYMARLRGYINEQGKGAAGGQGGHGQAMKKAREDIARMLTKYVG